MVSLSVLRVADRLLVGLAMLVEAVVEQPWLAQVLVVIQRSSLVLLLSLIVSYSISFFTYIIH